MARNEANDGLGAVDVEIVADDIPPSVGGGAAQHVAEKSREILLGPCVADHPLDLASGDVESGDQGLSAVPPILELTPFDLAWHHRQPRRDTLQGLNAGHLVDGLRSASFLKNAPLSAARCSAPGRVASPRRQSRAGSNG